MERDEVEATPKEARGVKEEKAAAFVYFVEGDGVGGWMKMTGEMMAKKYGKVVKSVE